VLPVSSGSEPTFWLGIERPSALRSFIGGLRAGGGSKTGSRPVAILATGRPWIIDVGGTSEHQHRGAHGRSNAAVRQRVSTSSCPAETALMAAGRSPKVPSQVSLAVPPTTTNVGEVSQRCASVRDGQTMVAGTHWRAANLRRRERGGVFNGIRVSMVSVGPVPRFTGESGASLFGGARPGFTAGRLFWARSWFSGVELKSATD
jgi:hypothetical protein